jgi:hypothetical protein
VTNPNPASPQVGVLTLPLSALQDFLKLRDPGGTAEQKIIDNKPTGERLNHPHAQWVTSDGKLITPCQKNPSGPGCTIAGPGR